MGKFLSIFKNRNFSLLFFASFTSQMGSVIGMTAFTFYLLDRFSKQPMYATITELMYSLPILTVFFLVGVFADRMDRQKIAYRCDWIRVIISICFLLSIKVGWMPLIFAVLFLRSAVSQFFAPAQQAIVQGILSKAEYTTSAGLNQMTSSVFMLFGNGLGIFAYWLIGIEGAILIDAISFVISAILIRSCKISEQVLLPNGKHKLKDLHVSLVLKDFKDGFKYIVSYKLLMSILIGFIVFGVVNGGFSVMPVFILKYKLAPDTYEQVSIWLGIVFGSGVLIGSVIASSVSQKMKIHHLIILGILLTGFFIVFSSFTANIYVFLLLVFIASFGLPFVNIGLGGWLPSIVDPKMMGRVDGWISPLMMISQSITLGFIAVSFPSFIPVEGLFWIVGGCLILVGAYYSVVLPRYKDEAVVKAADIPSIT